MSSDWPEVRVEDIAATESNALATGPFGSAISSRFFTESGVPVIRGSNLSADIGVKLIDENLVFVSPEKAKEFSRAIARRGDLVFTCWGTINQVGLIHNESKYREYVVSNKQMKLTVDQKKVDPKYVYYVFSSPEKQEEILSNGIGAAVPGFNLGQLKKQKLRLPPLVVQKEVVKTLDALDSRISLNRRINQTLEAMAQAIFKSWFVDFDPVKAKIAALQEGCDPLRAAMSAISGKPDAELDALPPEQYDPLAATATLFPDEMEESGTVPQGWEISILGELCRTNGGSIQTGPFGSQLHAQDYVAAGVPVVMPQDLSGRRINTDKIARIRELDARRLHRHRMQAGDIVFSRRGDVGRHALVTSRETGWLCGTGCLLVRPSTSAKVSAYVSCALAQRESLEWLTRHAVGATMPNLNTTILSDLPILLPPSAVMTAFQERIGAFEAATSARIAEAETLAKLRDTLLPKLLSGELSVAGVNDEVAHAL